MGTFFGLIGGLKGIAVIALILLVGGWAFTQKRAVEKAELARDQAIVQRDMAGQQRDKAIAAAQLSDATITRLEQEKKDINDALNTLALAKETNRTNTVTREVIIQNQATVPANSAQAAPVLGSIIAEVQRDRVRRRAQ